MKRPASALAKAPILLCLWASWAVAAPQTRIDLQALVNASAAGDTLALKAARYSGAILDRPLTLMGRGPATIIDGGGAGHGLTVEAPDVAIKNLRVIHSGTDVTLEESGIWVDSRAARIEIAQIQIEQCGFGIWIDGAAKPTIVGCQIIGRTDEAIVSDLGNGIHLFKVEGGLVADNSVVHGRDGIYISNSTGCLIRDNRIDRTRFAIHYMYSHANQIIGNRADSSSVGIALMYSKNLQVLDNQVHGCHTHGILLRNLYYSRIADNRTWGNEDGFFFSGCNYDTLTANLVTQNALGLLVSDSRDNAVYGNAISDNAQQLSYQDNKATAWEGNYWSDYLGWDRNGDGIGDKKHYPADIASYLVYRFPTVRLVMHSPAMKLLQGLEAQFPVIRPPGVVELKPLMRNPIANGSP
ncbi:MAG: nitrous oxide reductase family maturation protein NosD [Candidatus Latescibacteria bacterium]|nr:nitrous oxide reductase family maturation protein NosD [Candidatus Latescibacterota bacterium]